MAKTLEEAFAEFDNVNLGPNEAYFVIDPDTRTITVPTSEQIFGVESDYHGERKYFICPRYVGNNLDLSTLQIRINYINAGGESDQYWCTDVEVKDDNITFSWEISRHLCQYKGVISFIVCAVKFNGYELVNEWNTTIAKGTVLEGIEYGGNEPDRELITDWVHSVISDVQREGQRVIESLPGDYTDLNNKVNQQSMQVVELKQKLEQGGSGFSESQLTNLCEALKGAKYDTLEASLSAKEFVESVLGESEEEEPTPPTPSEPTLTSISVTWSGESADVGTDPKTLITSVKANYSDSTSQTITDYTVTPSELAEGDNTVTVSYNGKSTTKIIVGNAIGGEVVEMMPLTALSSLYGSTKATWYSDDGNTQASVSSSTNGKAMRSKDKLTEDSNVKITITYLDSKPYISYLFASCDTWDGSSGFTTDDKMYRTTVVNDGWGPASGFPYIREYTVSVKAGCYLVIWGGGSARLGDDIVKVEVV